MADEQKRGINNGTHKSHNNSCAPRKRTGPTKPERRLAARRDYYDRVLAPLQAHNPSAYDFTRPGSLNK